MKPSRVALQVAPPASLQGQKDHAMPHADSHLTPRNASRRRFLIAAQSALAGVGLAGSALAAPNGTTRKAPPVTAPRSTDGDDRHEPAWDERLSIRVGPKKGDLVGNDDRVIQAAVDYMARLGGGTVELAAGTYTLRNAVSLASGVRLLGSGRETIITKVASATTELAAESDWYDQEITLKDASSFRVGDGVVLRAKNPHNGATDVIKRTLVARSGNRFKLNDGLRKNLWLSGKPTCASLFPLLTSERTSDITIEALTLDGNGKNNTNLNGNYAGCVFLQDANRITIRNVTASNYNGDGISFQICHDVIVEDCTSRDHNGLGLHPGSGSQRPLIRGNRLLNNRIGLFWCWGVKYGLAEQNHIQGNRDYGISIGHNDTDNVMRNNEILDSGKVGVLFRNDDRGRDFWANRNTLEHNRIQNSGSEAGVAIDVQGKTRDLVIADNQLLETRGPARRTGIQLAAVAGRVELKGNSIEGFAQPIVDRRKR